MRHLLAECGVGCVPRAISEFLGANTRIASSRSREGWRSLDFTAKLWKHPAGCSLLVPAPDRCLPDRRTRNKPRGPAGEKPPPQGNPTPRSKTAARPNAQRLIAPPPQSAGWSAKPLLKSAIGGRLL